MSALKEFEVTLHDLANNTITANYTPNTPIVNLIEDFRKVAPDINKKQRIILLRENRQLKRGTLGDNGIRSATSLFVVYTENTACIDPEPITPYVYEWIEEGAILFYDPTCNKDVPLAHIPMTRRYNTYHANTDLLAEYNEWITGQTYRFFLTHASPRAQRSFPSDRFEPNGIVHYQPLVDPHSPLNITLYPEGIPSDSHETMGLNPFSSVKGTLHSIKLRVTIELAENEEEYECNYQFNVFLKGPIEIRDDRSTIIRSLGEEAMCVIKYDQIVKCDEYGEPMIPKVENAANANAVAGAVAVAVANRNQGGSRSKKSKRSGRSKKTRRTKRRI